MKNNKQTYRITVSAPGAVSRVAIVECTKELLANHQRTALLEWTVMEENISLDMSPAKAAGVACIITEVAQWTTVGQ